MDTYSNGHSGELSAEVYSTPSPPHWDNFDSNLNEIVFWRPRDNNPDNRTLEGLKRFALVEQRQILGGTSKAHHLLQIISTKFKESNNNNNNTEQQQKQSQTLKRKQEKKRKKTSFSN